MRCRKPRRMRYAKQRARIGDWEGDSGIDKHHQEVLATLTKRKLRHILAGQLPAKHADGVTERVNHLLPSHQDKGHTVTFDNGKEFAGHAPIASKLEAAISLTKR